MWEGRFTSDSYKEKGLGDPTLLWFLLIECVKPVYESCSRVLEHFFVPDLWEKGYCPVCGELPPIAQISSQKGTKLLFCAACGIAWQFPLPRCPYCGQEEDMRYLSMESERQYRIAVCKACGKYLKTIDSELIGSAVPLDIENLATLHLDILAQQQGYRRGSSFPLLI
jgi:FdhE protein